jgi:hypothetical protein
MRRVASALLFSAVLACDGTTPFGQRPPTAKIVGPEIAARDIDFFLTAQISSSVGVDSLKWSILRSTPGSDVTIVEELGPMVRLRASGEGQVTIQVQVSDFNGVAFDQLVIDLRDRILDRSISVPGTPNSRVGELLFDGRDLNDDGHNDIIAVDPLGRVDLKDSGFLEIFLGDREGLEPEPALRINDPEPENLNQFGASVAVGDINGDGFQDLLVGAPGYNTRTDTDVGRIYVYFSIGENLSSAPEPFILEIPETDFGADVDGDHFGSSVVTADFNLDGIDDFAVSAPDRERFELDFQEGGEIYVFLGNTDGVFTAPDRLLTRANVEIGFGASEQLGARLFALPSVCGSPAPDLATQLPGFDRSESVTDVGAVLVYCSGADLFIEEDGPFFFPQGLQSGDEFGATVVHMGDFDLDGRPEIAIGAPGRNSVFVVGAPNAEEFTEITGPVGSFRFGESIAATDLDVNGNNDLIVAVPDDGAGHLLIYSSSPLGIEEPFQFVSPSLELEEFGRSLLSVGDIDGDGLQDVSAGIPGSFGGGVRLVF